MKHRLLIASLAACLAFQAASVAAPVGKSPAPGPVFNVRSFGAAGDGCSKDTAAIQKALDACLAAGGGTVVIPDGIYLTGSVVVGSNTTLKLDTRASLMGSPDIADYPLVRVRWEGEFAKGHRALISAEKAAHVAITGPGSIFGPPVSLGELRNPRGPVLIEVADSSDVTLDGFSTQYERLWSIHFLFCQNVTARNLVIRSILSNSDGIDVDSCKDVLIEHCDINTGDDAISLKSGRGLAAMQLARPAENIVIRNCSLFSSMFAGIGFGTEMSGGMRNIRIENCTLSGHQNGMFFKSRDGRGGYFENIVGEHLTILDSPTFIAINLLNKGIAASDPVPGPVEQWARFHQIRFHDIRVSNVAALVLAKNIAPERPIDGLSLTDISGTCGRGIILANATNVELGGISVTGFQGPLLTTDNVTGSGLADPSAAAAH